MGSSGGGLCLGLLIKGALALPAEHRTRAIALSLFTSLDRVYTGRGAYLSLLPTLPPWAGRGIVRAQQLQLRLWHVQLAVAGQRMSVSTCNAGFRGWAGVMGKARAGLVPFSQGEKA